MQLPFTPVPRPPPPDPEVLKQKRQEMAKRLVQMNVKRREEKVQRLNHHYSHSLLLKDAMIANVD